jgi:hypothetical protein
MYRIVFMDFYSFIPREQAFCLRVRVIFVLLLCAATQAPSPGPFPRGGRGERQKKNEQTKTKQPTHTPPFLGEGLRAGDKQHTNKTNTVSFPRGGRVRDGGFRGIISIIIDHRGPERPLLRWWLWMYQKLNFQFSILNFQFLASFPCNVSFNAQFTNPKIKDTTTHPTIPPSMLRRITELSIRSIILSVRYKNKAFTRISVRMCAKNFSGSVTIVKIGRTKIFISVTSAATTTIACNPPERTKY